MERHPPAASAEIDLGKYWRLRGRLDSIRAAKSATHEAWIEARERLQRAERRAERQKDRPRGRAVEMYDGGSVPAGSTAEQIEGAAIEALRIELARLKAEGDALEAKSASLGPLVQRCTDYLTGLGLIGPTTHIPATPSSGRAA